MLTANFHVTPHTYISVRQSGTDVTRAYVTLSNSAYMQQNGEMIACSEQIVLHVNLEQISAMADVLETYMQDTSLCRAMETDNDMEEGANVAAVSAVFSTRENMSSTSGIAEKNIISNPE